MDQDQKTKLTDDLLTILARTKDGRESWSHTVRTLRDMGWTLRCTGWNRSEFESLLTELGFRIETEASKASLARNPNSELVARTYITI